MSDSPTQVFSTCFDYGLGAAVAALAESAPKKSYQAVVKKARKTHKSCATVNHVFVEADLEAKLKEDRAPSAGSGHVLLSVRSSLGWLYGLGLEGLGHV